MNIPISEIKDLSDDKVFKRGKQIQKTIYGIKSSYETDSDIHISGYVEGSYDNEYYVSMYYDEKEREIYNYQCECPAYHSYRGMCKHCVALALNFVSKDEEQQDKETTARNAFKGFKTAGELLEEQRQQKALVSKAVKNTVTNKELYGLINTASIENRVAFLQPDITGTIELVPTLYRTYWGWSVNFKIGNSSKYVLKDINKLLMLIDKKEEYSYGMKLKFIHDYSAFTEESKKIVDFLRNYMKAYKHYTIKSFYNMPVPAMRDIELNEQSLIEFFKIMGQRSIAMDNSVIDSRNIEFVKGNPILMVKLEKARKGDGYSLKLPAIEGIGNEEALFIRVLDKMYECDNAFSKNMCNICRLCDYYGERSLDISEGDMSAFCATLLPKLKEYTNFDCVENIEEYMPQDVAIKLYFDKNSDNITCKLTAEYGNDTYNIVTAISSKPTAISSKPTDNSCAFRDIEKESAVLYQCMEYFDEKTNDDRLVLNERNEEKLYSLLSEGIPRLKNISEVYVSENFKKLKVNSAPKIKIGVSINAGLLDITFDTGDFPQKEIEGILRNYRIKKKYYRLKGGDFVSIEDNSLAVLSEISDTFEIKNKDIAGGVIKLPAFRAMYVEQILRENEAFDIEIKKDKGYKAVIRNIKAFDDSDYEVPQSLENIMRNYQKTGYRWLRTIDSLGFGGILADDMGLGKSIQIIAYILGKKSQDNIGTSLIVCPASLVYNWENEIQKFGDGLKTLVVAGSIEERREELIQYKEYDIVVTSYDLLKRDIEIYKQMDFYSMIIDEAQNIKNHITQAARAVKSVNAVIKFALTGTPIENRLSELWSIFDYLMPGLLYSYNKFKKEYETSIIETSFKRDDRGNIINKQNDFTVNKLQKIIRPFIMRRIKEDVLKEIPDKNEEIIYSKLTGEQLKLYKANLSMVRNGLKTQNKETFENNKLKILAAITRLRQLCCAPALVYEDYKGDSAKLDTCMELIKNAIEGNHKVLLFSQFTSVFDILEKKLNLLNIPYYRLDGSTGKAKRIQLVEEFNNNDIPLFLISLKAGGTGLNLTSASIVIHFDPWWNIAAQNQATDRAHRIGQTKVVSVFKLIAKDTIEEKIIKLQEAKQELSNQIINEGGISISELTREDFKELIGEDD